MISSDDILNPTEQEWLVDQIRKAESHSTGEIRVHLEDFSLDYPLDRASQLFASLEMHKTQFRNGVLIYISAAQHGIAIIGDMGINQYIDQKFWNDERSIIESYFQKEQYYEGLAVAVFRIGQKLKEHFPLGEQDNPNELPNEISY